MEDSGEVEEEMNDVVFGLIYSSISLATPILLVSIIELIVEKGGVLNLSIEGSMLIGAFSAFMVAYYTDNLIYASITAAFSGLLLCLLFAFLTIALALDQMVTGIALNLLALGVTSYLYRASFGWYVSPIPPHIEKTIATLEIPVLSKIPLIGELLFNHIPHTYIAFIMVFICWFLFKTDLGLKIRAIGEDPEIAEALGINVNVLRYILLLVEGAIAGISGSLLSIAYYNMFLDNMTSGRGYVAIALIILARWNPLLLLPAVYFFNFVDVLQLRIQASGLAWFPYQFSLMLPYLFTILALFIMGRRVRGPSSLAKPYKKLR
ncbi:MAG: ABC transporter permease [Candidatus Methanomethylicia archaeon]